MLDVCCRLLHVALHNLPRLASGELCIAAGMFLNLALGPALGVSGYAFAPASIISPFTGFNIVCQFLAAWPLFVDASSPGQFPNSGPTV